MECIVNHIKQGRENAIHVQELAKLLNESETTIKKMVRNARKQGTCIISCKDGYYMATTRKEEMDFLRQFHKQTITRFSTVKTIRKDLKENPNQLTFTNVEGAKNEQ